MTSVTVSDALIQVSESILGSIDELNRLEFQKKGRKYRFVDNSFRRIREEDKHLIINPENLEKQTAVISAYYILSGINEGLILDEYRDLCLSIVGVAGELERKGWYEEENSSIIHLKNAKSDLSAVQAEALEYASAVTHQHIARGLDLMVCSKLNFLHTDHHVGAKLEGQHLRYYVKEYYGEAAMNSTEVLIALKGFVHWGNIKGVLYKLNVPNIDMPASLKKRFESFPEPSDELKDAVYDRYPSGTSKYSLIRKAIDVLGDWKFSELVPYPNGLDFDLDWLFALCHSIESDPIRFHLRSAAKNLSVSPANLNEISSGRSSQINKLLQLISLMINIFEETGGEFLLQNSKIPKMDESLINQNLTYYQELVKIKVNIERYQEKQWDADDIILRLKTEDKHGESWLAKVSEMREKYSDDYE